jgi:formylglycine-generating enzyme required for sulfatase activity
MATFSARFRTWRTLGLLGLVACGRSDVAQPVDESTVASSPWLEVTSVFAAEATALPDAYRCESAQAVRGCFVSIPAGSTWMGAQAADVSSRGFDPRAESDEGPVHRVRLQAYRIQRDEVSVSLYRRCVSEGACTLDTVDMASGLSELSDTQSQSALNGISWFGAATLCAWLGGRLPTEAQWERAARGDDS